MHYYPVEADCVCAWAGAEAGGGAGFVISFQDKFIGLSFPKKGGTFWCKGCTIKLCLSTDVRQHWHFVAKRTTLGRDD